MPDLETRLRELLADAAPTGPAPTGLADGARRHARRARRVRRAGIAAVVALVLGVAGAVTVQGGRDRGLQPAVPRNEPLDLCPSLQRTIGRLTQPPPPPMSARSDAVLVCALTGSDSVWPGSLPPDEAVDQPATLDSLDWRLRTDPAQPRCGRRPSGPAFTVSYRDLGGRAHTFRNTDLLCDGWPFLATYYVALSEQGAAYWSTHGDRDPWPVCPSLLVGRRPVATGQGPALPRGTRLTSASLCGHPAVDPLVVTSDTVPRILYVRRSPVGEKDLATLNAALARTGATQGSRHCAQVGRLAVTWEVRAVTSTGAEVALQAPDACLPTLEVDGDPHTVLTLDPTTLLAVIGDRDRFP